MRLRCTPPTFSSPDPRGRAAARAGSGAQAFALLLFGTLGCNELTGVNDLSIEACQIYETQRCTGPLGCPGLRSCQSDGTFSECDCGQSSGGTGGSGSGDSEQVGSGGMSGQGGGAAPAGQGGGLGVEPAGSVEPYAACATTADCVAGYACDGEVCRKRCDAAADCSDFAGSQCAPPLTQGDSFCTANCDIFSPGEPASGYRACGAGVHCLRSANLADATDCFYTRGVTRDGSVCQRDGSCLPGSICVRVTDGTDGICRRLCQPGTECTDGSPCGAFPTPVLIGGREVGICDARVCDPVDVSRNDGQFRPCLDGAYCLPGVAQSVSPRSSCLEPEGVSGAGFACQDHTDCSSGLGCDAQTGQCAFWCRTEADCSAGSCALVQTGAGQSLQVVPGDTLGLCIASGS